MSTTSRSSGNSNTYQALELTRFGGPEAFRLTGKPRVPLKAGQLRIAVRAAGVNFADVMMRMGSYPEAPPLPFVPGYEVAGTIAELGPEVTRFEVGDRVVAGTRFGGYTSELVLPERYAWPTPARLSDVEAAAIPVNYLTAWMALDEMARVRKGDRVLIHSAAGGVGTAAVQLAVRAGARVTGLTGSPAKGALIRELGAEAVLSTDDYERAGDKDAGGFDVILDPTGGASLKRSFRRLAPSGRIVFYGVSSMVTGRRRSIFKAVRMLAQSPLIHPLWLMKQNTGMYGLNLLQLFDPANLGRLGRGMDLILGEFGAGHLRAVVGRTFPLAEGGAAHEHLQSRANTGKVVLTCPGS